MSSITPHFVLEAGPRTGHEALFQPDWLARELPQSAGLHPSMPRLNVRVAMPGFYTCAGDVNSGLACLVYTHFFSPWSDFFNATSYFFT